jgi:hypothetical protein
MKKLIYTFSLLVLFSLQVAAQGGSISGRVTDSTGEKGLDKATVKLVEKAAPKDTSRTFTNSKGEFLLNKIPTSAYYIIVTYSGYQPLVKEFFKPSAGVSNIDLGDLTMLTDIRLLKEIIIEAPAVTIKEDTVEYNAKQFQTKPNATTEDLLKKLPGVQVDRQGNITAQGKQVTRVKVNGKDFFSGDPKTATKELPADMIDKVQVVDDYGDQASASGIRDGEPEKVINLQLKKDKNKGVFGRAQAGHGTNDRYIGALTFNRFNNNRQISLIANSNNTNTSTFSLQDGGGGQGGGLQMNIGGGGGNRGGGGGMGMSSGMGNLLGSFGGQDNQNGITRLHSVGLNFRNDWGKRNSFYGSYTYSDRKSNTEQLTSQQNLLNNLLFVNNTNQRAVNKSGTHRAFANLELWVDSFNYIKFSQNFSYTNSNNQRKEDFDFFKSENIKTQNGIRSDSSVNKRPNFRSNLLYNHRFKKRGRNLSLNTDINFSENESDQLSGNITQFYDANGNPLFNNNLLQSINQDNRSSSINVRATYTEPLSTERFLDFSYTYNRNFSNNDRKVFSKDPVNGSFNFIDSLSNAFKNNFNFNRFGASLRTQKKKYNYTLGVLFQPVLLEGVSITKDSGYKPIRNFNWFPVARFSYNFTKTKSFNFNYNGNARQPSFEQLQPVTDKSNLQFQREGNPGLRPAISHTFNTGFNSFNFSSGRILLTNVSLNIVKDQIVNNVITLRAPNGQPSGAQLTRPENVQGFYNANFFFTYSQPFKNRKYVLSLLGLVNYNNNINLVDGIKNIGRNWLAAPGLNFDYNLSWLELSTGARYNLNYATFTLPSSPKQNQSTWTLSSDARFDFGKGWILRWDFDYTINRGLAAGVQRDIALLNGSLEKEMFKKKNGVLKLAGFDIFKQNTNISRSVNGTNITDIQVNRLTQYFMLSFTYRFNKFKGQVPQQNNFRRMGGGRVMGNN